MHPTSRVLAICSAIVLSLVVFSAQAQDGTIKDVRVAVSAGDSRSLTDFFHNVVELTTDKEEGSYSKNQAEFVLKSFFRKYPSSAFQYNHVGSSPGGGKYTIGTYKFDQGTFRVFINYRKSAKGTLLIDKMEFTRE